MRSIKRFRHLMSSTVLIAERTSINTYGAATYGPDVLYQAHIKAERRLVRDSGGQAVGANIAIYLGVPVIIHPTARITLSTGDVGSTQMGLRQPPILAVDRSYDQNGLHHVILRVE